MRLSEQAVTAWVLGDVDDFHCSLHLGFRLLVKQPE